LYRTLSNIFQTSAKRGAVGVQIYPHLKLYSIMSAAQQAMETLTKQWYNAITSGFALDPQSFQLYQGNLSLGTTSDWLWNIFDTVPPESINNVFDPAQENSFAKDYGGVISNLKVGDAAEQFKNCLGDSYESWQKYVAGSGNFNIATKPDAAVKLFQSWAALNAPGKISCATSLIQSIMDPVNQASMMYAMAKADGKGFAYNETIESLKSKLAGEHSKAIELNSKTASSEMTHVWTEVTTKVFFGLFSHTTRHDKITEKATSAGLNIKFSVQNQLTLAAGPLKTAHDSDPVLKNYLPWYNAAALSNAYADKSSSTWKGGTPNWQSTFGPNGNMQYMTTAIVVVDGIDLTMTSEASFSSSEQETIQSSTRFGIWPLFGISGHGGWSNKVSFSDSGKITVQQKSPVGNPVVLGVLVSPTSAIFS
jgi:hypothetical protein